MMDFLALLQSALEFGKSYGWMCGIFGVFHSIFNFA